MSALDALVDRVARDGELKVEDAPVVLAAHDLITIGMMADTVRRRRHGARTTFLRVFEMHVDAVPAAAPAHMSAGEYRLVGEPATLDAACAAVESARKVAAAGFLTGFSLHDIVRLDPSPRAFERLKAAGLDGLAEVVVDQSAVPAAEIPRARGAGLVVERLTVRAVPQDPAGLMERVLALQRTGGGFRAFAPLARQVSAATPTTGYDDLKLVALARLIVSNIDSIQVDWPLYGPKLAQVALTAGADDVDGVAAADPGVLGPRRSALEEIRGNIQAAGLQAVERDGRFAARHAAAGDAIGVQ
jgi:aminodeoxyfutalosine synthase